MSDTALAGGAEAAGFGATSTVADLVAFAGDLLRPSTVSQQMHSEATDVQFPGPVGRVARVRDAAAQRLGAGLRDQGRQVAALDGFGQLGRAPTGISASQGRFCGSIPTLTWRSWC